jgi:hypothetical protein
MPVDMSSSVSIYMPNALSHMLCVICRFIYVECHVLAVASLHSDQLYAYLSTSLCMLCHRSHMPVTVYLHLYAGTWVPNICCKMPSLLIYQLQYVYIYMPAHECLAFSMSCQVSIYVKLLYLSSYAKCFVSRVICRMIWAICQNPYARLLYAKYYDHCYVF